MPEATLNVGPYVIGADHPPLVVAEAGVNHNGDVARAHALVTAAEDASVDVIKFQTFDPSRLVSKDAPAARYQQLRGSAATQADLLASLQLPREAWRELAGHASDVGLLFLSTPFDMESAEMLAELGVAAYKVGSGDLTNLTFLAELSRMGRPMLLSTGMSEWSEVDAACETCDAAPGLALLHCVSSYPAPLEDSNLSAIPRMAQRYGVPIGWSDHTVGSLSAIAAVALGASVLEKHFTLDATLPGPDHAASLEPPDMARYADHARITKRLLGDGDKRPAPSERENITLMRRSWHARQDLIAGAVIRSDDLVALRPESGVSATVDLDGLVILQDVGAGNPVHWHDIAWP